MKFRKLKVYSKARQRTWDYTIVPEIRLEGRWLANSGFEEGKEFKVETKKGKLIITLIREDKST